MRSAKLILQIALFLTLLYSPFVQAASGSDSAHPKKAVEPKTQISVSNKEEMQIVIDAQKEFARAKYLPPPSEHMQKKMDSGG